MTTRPAPAPAPPGLDAPADLSSQVRRGLGWSTVSNVLLRLGSVVLGIALARLLTPSEFGAYAVALAVQMVLVSLADLGLSADLIRAEDPERRAPSVGTLGLLTGSSLALLMALTAGPVAAASGSPESADAIRVLSLTLVLAGAGVVPYAMLLRRFEQRSVFVIALIDFVVSTTVTIVLVVAGYGVMSLAIGRVVAQVITMVLQFRLSRTRPRFGLDRTIGRSVLAFGVPIAAANVLSWVLLNVDNIVIARIGGVGALGFYVLAFNISNWPMSVIGQIIRSVALPGFARSEPGHDGPRIATFATLVWTLALPAGVGLAALSAPLVAVVYGARWAPSAPVLAVLGLFGALRVLFDLLSAFLLSRGAPGVVLAIQVGWFVALVPAVVVGARTHGAFGAGVAHLVVAVVLVLPAYLWAVHRLGVPITGLVGAVLAPVPAAAAAAGAGLSAVLLLDRPLLQLLAGGAAGAVVYAVLVRTRAQEALAAARAGGPHAPAPAGPPAGDPDPRTSEGLTAAHLDPWSGVGHVRAGVLEKTEVRPAPATSPVDPDPASGSASTVKALSALTTQPTPPRTMSAGLHRRIEDAGWRRPVLDRVAEVVGRGSRVRAIRTRQPAPRLAPVSTHRVSVVIPCFNYGRFLPEAVSSALSQRHADVEVVVVDDASTDDSLAVARRLESLDSRVRVVASPVNQGHVRAFNRGYAEVTGDFVVRLDADDLLAPDSVARALAVFEELPEVGLVYGHPRHFTEADPPTPLVGDVTWSVWEGSSWVEERCRRGVNCITTPEAVVRRSVMQRTGPLNTKLRFAQDMEMWLRAASVSDVARLDDVDQALHRDHAASMSVNDGSGEMTDLVERRRVFHELFASTGAGLAEREAMQADAAHALAREALAHALYSWDRGRDEAVERAELLAFARETWPEVVHTRQWAVIESRIARRSTGRSLTSLVRVASRRLRHELEFLRWTRTGL